MQNTLIKINLLPWRENKKIEELKKFKLILLIITIIIISSSVVIHSALSIYQDKLQEELIKLTPSSTVHQDIDLTQEINNIKTDQIFMQKIYYYLLSHEKIIHFTEIKKDHSNMIFIGETPNANELTQFLLKWQAAHLFSKIELDYLKKQEKNGQIIFRFRAFRI